MASTGSVMTTAPTWKEKAEKKLRRGKEKRQEPRAPGAGAGPNSRNAYALHTRCSRSDAENAAAKRDAYAVQHTEGRMTPQTRREAARRQADPSTTPRKNAAQALPGPHFANKAVRLPRQPWQNGVALLGSARNSRARRGGMAFAGERAGAFGAKAVPRPLACRSAGFSVHLRAAHRRSRAGVFPTPRGGSRLVGMVSYGRSNAVVTP